MRIRTVDISDEVAGVLRRGQIRMNSFRLPNDGAPLARPLYEAVNKVLMALGGKWDRKSRAHIFPADVRADLMAALESGSIVDQKKTLEQFFTPVALASQMARALGLTKGQHVLEPSCGDGMLIAAAQQEADGLIITAVEIDQGAFQAMLAKIDGGQLCRGVYGFVADFMSWGRVSRIPIDAVIMNPPFSGNQDIAHVRRAFQMLRPGGKLVAIMSPHFTFAEDKPSIEFRAMIDFPKITDQRVDFPYICGGDGPIEECTVWGLPAGTFKESGTGVGSIMILIEKAA